MAVLFIPAEVSGASLALLVEYVFISPSQKSIYDFSLLTSTILGACSWQRIERMHGVVSLFYTGYLRSRAFDGCHKLLIWCLCLFALRSKAATKILAPTNFHGRCVLIG
jgi:hypothetical protein